MQRLVLAPGKQVLMLRLDFSVIETGAGPTLSLWCHCGACKVGDRGWELCVCHGQSDGHQTGGDTRWRGPGRLMDG